MSFRLYVYYCALCGGWAAFAGWIAGRIRPLEHPLASAGVKGLCLGLFVALGLSLLDAFWNLSRHHLGQACGRVLVAVLVGTIGGMAGGTVGQALFSWQPYPALLIVGWTITGLLIGASIGVFEILQHYLRQDGMGGAVRKIVRGVLGGTAGGLLGGTLSLLLRGLWGRMFQDMPVEDLWSPSGTGFIVLGACIGLLVGLAQVILRQAWLRIEHGHRAGRELLLTKPEVLIGRAESCDVGLFGDAAVEREHAHLVLEQGQYVLRDAGTPGGTYVNDQRISAPTPLRAGDLIRVGGALLRFGERRKRA
jgi:MFS family permease